MDRIKPILAIETSESLCSVCAYFDEEKYFELSINMKHSHAEKLFDLTDTIVRLAGTELKDYYAAAVSAGPGSFTGLRIGFSAVKGLALGAGLPVIVVPTFEALALYLSGILPDGSEFIIANKVNTSEIYFSRFHVKGNSYIFAENLQIVTYAEFVQKSKESLVFGNAFTGSDRTENLTAPSGKAVAKWAKLNGTITYEYDFIEPNYMKNFIIKEKK